MGNIRLPVCRSVFIIAGLALSLAMGCRDNSPVPYVPQQAATGGSKGGIDPDRRGSGGRTGTGGDEMPMEGGATGTAGAAGAAGPGPASDGPVSQPDALAPMTDAHQEPEVGADVPVTCSPACD